MQYSVPCLRCCADGLIGGGDQPDHAGSGQDQQPDGNGCQTAAWQAEAKPDCKDHDQESADCERQRHDPAIWPQGKSTGPVKWRRQPPANGCHEIPFDDRQNGNNASQQYGTNDPRCMKQA